MNNRKLGCYLLSLAFVWIFLASPQPALASYVLPYPAFMPGNKIYRVTRLVDALKKWWYWGSIGSFKYNLLLSDKYLVEAKTLFEYEQYPLAIDALNRSNSHFRVLPGIIGKIKTEGKDTESFQNLLIAASQSHESIINKLQSQLPAVFVWKPEKTPESVLSIGEILSEALKLHAYTK